MSPEQAEVFSELDKSDIREILSALPAEEIEKIYIELKLLESAGGERN